jgi:hypothetical protein
MINKKIDKHRLVEPSEEPLEHHNPWNEELWRVQNRVTYIDPIERTHEIVSEEIETTIDLYHGSGMGRDEIRERIKYDLVQQLASRLIHDELVDIEERVDDYRRTVVTKMTVKIKRD